MIAFDVFAFHAVFFVQDLDISPYIGILFPLIIQESDISPYIGILFPFFVRSWI